MNTEKIILGSINTNCYIVSSGTDAAVIDPACDGEKIFRKVEEMGCTVKYILLTHGHFDHIGGVDELARLSGAEIYIHPLDTELLRDHTKNGSAAVMGESIVCFSRVNTFEDGDGLLLGDKIIRVRHTPGHTRGSVCFFCGGEVFSGDTLFSDGYGRTDLYGGDHGALYNSLMKLLKEVRGSYVCPGHGDCKQF